MDRLIPAPDITILIVNMGEKKDMAMENKECRLQKTLTFIGMDSRKRPVYKDENGRLWKDTDNREGWLNNRNICSAYQNAFDGEPDCPVNGKYELVFIPERIVRGNVLTKKKIWGRIGMSVECTEEEYAQLAYLMETDKEEAAAYLNKLFEFKGVQDGESHLPSGCEKNPNNREFEF